MSLHATLEPEHHGSQLPIAKEKTSPSNLCFFSTAMRWRLSPLLNLMYFHYSFRRNLNNPANYSDFPRNQQKLRSRRYCTSNIDTFVSELLQTDKMFWHSVPPMEKKSLPEKSALHSSVTCLRVRTSLSQAYHFQLSRHWRVESESSGCVASLQKDRGKQVDTCFVRLCRLYDCFGMRGTLWQARYKIKKCPCPSRLYSTTLRNELRISYKLQIQFLTSNLKKVL